MTQKWNSAKTTIRSFSWTGRSRHFFKVCSLFSVKLDTTWRYRNDSKNAWDYICLQYNFVFTSLTKVSTMSLKVAKRVLVTNIPALSKVLYCRWRVDFLKTVKAWSPRVCSPYKKKRTEPVSDNVNPGSSPLSLFHIVNSALALLSVQAHLLSVGVFGVKTSLQSGDIAQNRTAPQPYEVRFLLVETKWNVLQFQLDVTNNEKFVQIFHSSKMQSGLPVFRFPGNNAKPSFVSVWTIQKGWQNEMHRL